MLSGAADDDRLPPGAPLAARLRPTTLDQFVGQKSILGEGTALRTLIEQGTCPSMILWGPPGSGKTTLARLVASTANARFVSLSAVSAGVADLRRIIAAARRLASATGRRTILFIDEIHRFNKAQQDSILPAVERGDLIFIGATTENPSFEVNAALLSRSRVFVLQPLAPPEVNAIIDRALADDAVGFAGRVVLEGDARDRLIALAGGDARVALNALETAAQIATGPHAWAVSARDIEEAMQRRALRYDKDGDQHYDVISAFIKSIRGSDPDAAVYWLARMLEAGEDPVFVARRLVILSAEDIGLAEPQALVIASAAQQAVHAIGMPEALYPLTEAAIYLSLAPKSNSGLEAYAAAKAALDESGALPVPLHLRNAPTSLMRGLGYGADYRYAHDYEDPKPLQQYLPTSLQDRKFYVPRKRGWEAGK
ncbi:MAG: replication-associated recombination protein A [Candidatus Eremiobacteraeota bacterium]|nr:replication-associated recombination protein A [Candidatus Eremiobacteraeota bacterium]MBC5826880.1 replication-associated recombination protein A [Candidatus Eremiobacteraeota bacterium]